MTAPTDFLIAALATGTDPNNWSVVDTLLSNVSSDITGDRATEWEFIPYASEAGLANGKRFGRGYPIARWKFRALRPEQRENLRDFCTGLSADVYIRTPTNETSAGSRTWDDFQAILQWTSGAELVGVNYVEEVVLEFTHLIAI